MSDEKTNNPEVKPAQLKAVSAKVSTEIREHLEMVAASERRTLSNLISNILEDYVEKKRTADNHAAA